MRRVIICGLFKYPRGGASANYIQYLASALQMSGYNVEILSYINKEYSENKEIFEYRNVKIHEISCQKGLKIYRRLMNGIFFSNTFSKRIASFDLNENDIVFAERSYPIVKNVLKLKRKYKFKTVGFPLEWFSAEDYTSARDKKEGMEAFLLCHKHDYLFPISHLIAKQFPDVPSLVLPIMADTQEYSFAEKRKTNYEFIFPANGMMKDALSEMIEGISMLSDEQLKKMKLHLTGVKEDTIFQIIGPEEYERLRETIVIHKWMKYDELIELYKKVHYLFLARKTCQMTMANFPSKVPETMTHGIVPVVSRVGDYTKYYLEDNVNSLIFDGYDKNACYAALCRALNTPFDEYRKLSEQARKCAEDRFDFRNWSDKIKDSLESMF